MTANYSRSSLDALQTLRPNDFKSMILLTPELVLDGLSSPTSIAFLDENNILLLEKEGSVRHISNGQLQPQPVLE